MESIDDFAFERIYLNLKLSIYIMGLLVMMSIYALCHVILSFFSENLAAMNPICLFVAVKIGIIFVEKYSMKFFNINRHHDILDDFYGIVLSIVGISIILHVTIMANGASHVVLKFLQLNLMSLGFLTLLNLFLIIIFILTWLKPYEDIQTSSDSSISNNSE